MIADDLAGSGRRYVYYSALPGVEIKVNFQNGGSRQIKCRGEFFAHGDRLPNGKLQVESYSRLALFGDDEQGNHLIVLGTDVAVSRGELKVVWLDGSGEKPVEYGLTVQARIGLRYMSGTERHFFGFAAEQLAGDKVITALTTTNTVFVDPQPIEIVTPNVYYSQPAYSLDGANLELTLFFSGAANANPAVVTNLLAAAREVWSCPGGVRLIQSQTAQNALEVELVANNIDCFQNQMGGGGFSCSSSKVVLDLCCASQNRYLLAHELGHFLGLDHPAVAFSRVGCSVLTPGDEWTILTPGTPNLPRNTENNVQMACTHYIPASFITSISNEPVVDPPQINSQADFQLPRVCLRNFFYDDGRPVSLVNNLGANLAGTPDGPAWWGRHPNIWNSNSAQLSLMPGSCNEYRHIDPQPNQTYWLHLQVDIYTNNPIRPLRLFFFRGDLKVQNSQIQITPVVQLPAQQINSGGWVKLAVQWTCPGNWSKHTWLIGLVWDSTEPGSYQTGGVVEFLRPVNTTGITSLTNLENVVAAQLTNANLVVNKTVSEFIQWVGRFSGVGVRLPRQPLPSTH